MTKILIDPQIFVAHEFGGISRYFTELYHEFEAQEDTEVIFPLLYTDNIHYKESRFYADSFQQKNSFWIKYSQIFRSYLPKQLKRKSKKLTISLLKAQEFDLFIPTYYDPYFLEELKEKPFVLTVHDMIHELFPAYFVDDPATAKNKKVLIERATKIIAISENTKKDILKFYPSINAANIEVIYLGHTADHTAPLDIDVPNQYLLFVGNRSFYKNFNFFLKAIAPLLLETEDLFLVCAGGNSFNTEEQNLIKDLSLSNKVLQRNFKDAELKSYYQKAKCFVFPSAYEGFGIPVLEAMSAGCPIVLTNNSSFPEVAGDAGIYFEPDNATDLKNKVETVLVNTKLREIHVTKGIEQAKKFTWKKTAAKTLSVYHQAIIS
jgi:glycosyltransferase involved in cell wall biosynthesis